MKIMKTKFDGKLFSILALLVGGGLFVLPSFAATFTWNRNLTSGDTANYSMWDDSNWVITGTRSGVAQAGQTAGPYTGDTLVVPNGIVAKMEDPATGGSVIRTFSGLVVGDGAPGLTRVDFKNNYNSGSANILFTKLLVGDPDNDFEQGQYSATRSDSGRNLILKGSSATSVITNFVYGSGTLEFYGKVIAGKCGTANSGSFSLRELGSNVTADGTLYGLQFRSTPGTLTALAPLSFKLGLQWRDASNRSLLLGSYDHAISDILIWATATGFGPSAAIIATGGSITMQDWTANQFSANTTFKLDNTSVKMVGNGDDTGIVLAVRGRDDGAFEKGFVDNFAFGTLVVGDSASDSVTLKSTSVAYAVGSASTAAALYVDTLDLSSGAALVIPATTRLYYHKLLGSPSNVTGAEYLRIVGAEKTLIIVR